MNRGRHMADAKEVEILNRIWTHNMGPPQCALGVHTERYKMDINWGHCEHCGLDLHPDEPPSKNHPLNKDSAWHS